MVHTCGSENCSCPLLEPGDEVVQLLRTTCYQGFITLTFAFLLAEWHSGCFHELRLEPQLPPCRCQSCGREIQDGEEVSFFIVGKETDGDHSVSEAMGEEIYSVLHVRCPAAKPSQPS